MLLGEVNLFMSSSFRFLLLLFLLGLIFSNSPSESAKKCYKCGPNTGDPTANCVGKFKEACSPADYETFTEATKEIFKQQYVPGRALEEPEYTNLTYIQNDEKSSNQNQPDKSRLNQKHPNHPGRTDKPHLNQNNHNPNHNHDKPNSSLNQREPNSMYEPTEPPPDNSSSPVNDKDDTGALGRNAADPTNTTANTDLSTLATNDNGTSANSTDKTKTTFFCVKTVFKSETIVKNCLPVDKGYTANTCETTQSGVETCGCDNDLCNGGGSLKHFKTFKLNWFGGPAEVLFSLPAWVISNNLF